jgi:hypothetical protein
MGRKRVNKSEKIRAALESLGFDAPSREVVAALKSQRVSVSSTQVANVRARLASAGSTARRRPSDHLTVPALLAAKRLLQEAGSIEAARQTLAALGQLL